MSHAALQVFRELVADQDMAIQIAVIKALTIVVKKSQAQTVMELEKELNAVVNTMKEIVPDSLFSVSAGSELFVRSFTRPKIDFKEIESLKQWVVQTTESVAQKSLASRTTISQLFDRFVVDGMTILTCSFSRVVMECFIYAAKQGKRFNVIVTESRGQSSGTETASRLKNLGIPVTIILDCAVGYHMREVDAVVVGAEAVAESGGFVAKPGPYQISILAQTFNVPVYVACESYKFSRIYPLAQDDLPNSNRFQHRSFNTQGCVLDSETSSADGLRVSLPRFEYTPPESITLLITDLGILTPSAVSDELIKLYLN
eukprot:c188_g1_i1.p1 GENE.c188_g1_i1~~c188_g1_i1.p1  ORF type:complete len:327 (-),score=70.08 c188_g1_i1:3-947(-)